MSRTSPNDQESPIEQASPRTSRPVLILFLAFCASFLLYLVALTLPYDLFTYSLQAPISLPEIAKREPLPATTFLVTIILLFGHYILAYRVCRRSSSKKLVFWILLFGLAMALLLSFTYPVGAGDVVDYVSYGEELGYLGANPLIIPPARVEGGVFTQYSAFRNATSNYGPLWTWISALVVRSLGRTSLALNLLGFKAVAILSYLGQALLIYAFLRRRDPARAPAGLLFFAWNPLILYEFAVNGHNDATMMVLALLGILFWQLDRPLLMVSALTLSFLVKIPTAPLLPIFLLGASLHRGKSREFWLRSIGGGILMLLIVALAYLSLPNGLDALTNLSGRSNLFTHSLPTIVKTLLQIAGMEQEPAQDITRTATLLALGVYYVIQLVRTGRKPSGALRYAFDFLLFLLLFATPWFQPWYITWLISLAALSPRRAARAQVGLFSFSVFFSYVVYGFVWFWIIPIANWGYCLGINAIAVGTTFLAPWIYTAWLWLRARKQTALA